jgi:hypothetical protein
VPLSPGSGEQVALQYSGAAEGKPLPMVLETVADSVNRGACILHLSQYPKEVEYLYPPMSFIAAAGTPRFAISADGLGVRVFPVQVSANQASRTVEQILGQKKRAHIAAFRFLVAETRAELTRIADTDGAAAERLASDRTKNQGGTHTVEGLLERIVRQVEEVVKGHEAVGEGEYADDAVFQGLVTGMLDARRWAVSKLRLWLEDRTQLICFMMDCSLCNAHRLLSAHLVRAAGAAAGTEEGRRAAAAACMERRLLQARFDEANDEGETPLVAAAADGATAADIRLLVAAGSAVNGAEGEPSAAAVKAAAFGHADALRALLEAKAAVNSSQKVLSPQLPVHWFLFEFGLERLGWCSCYSHGLGYAHRRSLRKKDRTHETETLFCPLTSFLCNIRCFSALLALQGTFTPLLAAAQSGHSQAVVLLLEGNANTEVPNEVRSADG